MADLQQTDASVVRTLRLSPVEHSSDYLLTCIIQHIGCKTDLICLALTSKTMARRIQPFILVERPCDDGWEGYVNLMSKLESWMPGYLLFCHHCLIYRPSIDFDWQGNRRLRICFSCSRNTKYPCVIYCSCQEVWDPGSECDGCRVVWHTERDLRDLSEGEILEWQHEYRGPCCDAKCCEFWE